MAKPNIRVFRNNTVKNLFKVELYFGDEKLDDEELMKFTNFVIENVLTMAQEARENRENLTTKPASRDQIH